MPPASSPCSHWVKKVADSEPYKACADLASAANVWNQNKRNLPVESGRLVLKKFASSQSDFANTLKCGLTRIIIRFYDHVTEPVPPALYHNQKVIAARNTRRPTRTEKFEHLRWENPKRVKLFRKITDRQSGKPLFKAEKFKIKQITDHSYITDKRKFYRKNYLCRKPNFINNISGHQITIGTRLPATTPATTAKKIAPLSQPALMEQLPANPRT